MNPYKEAILKTQISLSKSRRGKSREHIVKHFEASMGWQALSMRTDSYEPGSHTYQMHTKIMSGLGNHLVTYYPTISHEVILDSITSHLKSNPSMQAILYERNQ